MSGASETSFGFTCCWVRGIWSINQVVSPWERNPSCGKGYPKGRFLRSSRQRFFLDQYFHTSRNCLGSMHSILWGPPSSEPEEWSGQSWRKLMKTSLFKCFDHAKLEMIQWMLSKLSLANPEIVPVCRSFDDCHHPPPLQQILIPLMPAWKSSLQAMEEKNKASRTFHRQGNETKLRRSECLQHSPALLFLSLLPRGEFGTKWGEETCPRAETGEETVAKVR